MSRTDTQELERLMNKMKPVIVGMTPHWVYPSMAEWVTNGGTANTPLTSTSWDGDSYSTTAKTLIDLSAVFGVPAGVKAVLLFVWVRDSGSATNDTYLILGPTNSNLVGMAIDPHAVNDRIRRATIIVPCDANGDIYYQIGASGAGTFDVFIQIWGYYI